MRLNLKTLKKILPFYRWELKEGDKAEFERFKGYSERIIK